MQGTSSVYYSKSHENGLNQWEKTIYIQSSLVGWERSYGLRWYLQDGPRWRLCHYNLNQWGRVTHICIIGSDNGLSPGRRRAIIWTSAEILIIWPLRTKLFLQLIVKHHDKYLDFIPTIFPGTLQWRHMRLLAFAIISYSTAYSKSLPGLTKHHQSSTLLAPARGINRWCVVSLHKGPVMRRAYPSKSSWVTYDSCYNLFFHRQVQLWNTPKNPILSLSIDIYIYIWIIQQHCFDIVGVFFAWIFA